MSEETERTRDEAREASDRIALARKLDIGGWGLIFIWLGVAWLASLSAGVVLVGTAVVVLGVQLVRKAVGLPLQVFSLFVGLCLAVAGIWRLAGLKTDIVPVLLIVAGVALLISAVARARRLA
jgi:hypothetical protein